MTQCSGNPEENYRRLRIRHWNEVATRMDRYQGPGRYYRKRLKEIFSHHVSPGRRVLELGCAQGDLLAALRPAYGIGVDFSEEMLLRARSRHPNLEFILADVHHLEEIKETFDFIILSDLCNDLWDVQSTFRQLLRLCHADTRVIINNYSLLWEMPLRWAARLGTIQPKLEMNWLTREDTQNLLYLSDMEVIFSSPEVLLPLPVPFIEKLFNRILAKTWPFSIFALANFFIARPVGFHDRLEDDVQHSVSVVVPARNEAGHIKSILERIPERGKSTEIIFVEGNSTDDTYAVIQREVRATGRCCKLLKQPGSGKGDAVRHGFAHASGDVLMILDADLTVAPEDLPHFYQTLVKGKADLVNGVRLVYPMEDSAMRFLNLLGNKFFSIVFSWLLGQPIKDTLCGTKVLYKEWYQRLAANRGYFGEFDPFGDFDLLFSAAKQKMKIVDLPIRYRERSYGQTNIDRWRHGWLLMKMAFFAAAKLRFF